MEQNEQNAMQEQPATSDREQPAPEKQYQTEFQQEVDKVAIGDSYNLGDKITYHGLAVKDFIELHTYMKNSEKEVKNREVSIENSDTQKFRENLETDIEDSSLPHGLETAGDEEQTEPPQSKSGLARWYYDLTSYERCFVQATAALHGSPVQAVKDAADELFSAYPQMSPEPVVTVEVEEPDGQQPDDPPVSSALEHKQIAPLSGDELLRRTFTTTYRIRGAERLFWQDTDQEGFSPLGLRALQFLAKEPTLAYDNHDERRFLDHLAQWPERLKGEASWRSARALGIVHWTQSVDTMRRQANAWMKSDQALHWRCASSYLAGIYELGATETERQVDDPERAVLWLLDQWTQRTHETGNGAIGRAVARTYGLIGRKSPTVALKGLEQLLSFSLASQSATKNSPHTLENLFLFGVSKYVDIVRSGHIRQVLKHLAEGAALHIRVQNVARLRGKRGDDTQANAATLNVILTAFSLITSCSLSAVDANATVTYVGVERLPASPPCPDIQGRDVLLAGLLASAEQHWQDYVAMLLCAFIMEKNYDFAFYLLYRWGEIVLKEQSPDAVLLEDIYVQFLIKTGQLLLSWSAERRSTYSIAIGVYKRRLTLWLTDRRLSHQRFKMLAQKALAQLPTT